MNYVCASLITNASADETTSPWIDVRGYTHLTFYLSSSGTTSSGVISLEEMLPAGYTATQVPYDSYTGPSSLIVTAIQASTFTGTAMTAHHMPVSAYAFVRARISTVIGGGGTVSVGLIAAS